MGNVLDDLNSLVFMLDPNICLVYCRTNIEIQNIKLVFGTRDDGSFPISHVNNTKLIVSRENLLSKYIEGKLPFT